MVSLGGSQLELLGRTPLAVRHVQARVVEGRPGRQGQVEHFLHGGRLGNFEWYRSANVRSVFLTCQYAWKMEEQKVYHWKKKKGEGEGRGRNETG